MRSTLVYVAWCVAVVATLASLYFSEVRGFVPCTLCWYQRILMYPLAYLLGASAWRGGTDGARLGLPFAVLGMGVSSFHYLEQKVPGFGFPEACRGGVPCNVAYVDWLGFVTIPFLALIAFTFITVLLVASARTGHGATPRAAT